MNKLFTTFLDRLAERFTAILAGVISSRVEGLRAEAQAEQQSQLEDLARKYEADGKIAIANTLRERALNLTASNLAGDGGTVIDAVAADPQRMSGPMASSSGGLGKLPDFSPRSRRERRTRPPAEQSAKTPQLPDTPGATS